MVNLTDLPVGGRGGWACVALLRYFGSPVRDILPSDRGKLVRRYIKPHVLTYCRLRQVTLTLFAY